MGWQSQARPAKTCLALPKSEGLNLLELQQPLYEVHSQPTYPKKNVDVSFTPDANHGTAIHEVAVESRHRKSRKRWHEPV